jgi:hypothetical protein
VIAIESPNGDACEVPRASLSAWESLRSEALARVRKAITNYGNSISSLHDQALDDIVSAMARQAHGLNRGRYAYAAPCGAGKTQAVVALIAAAHALGQPITLAVAANTIRALCLLKRDLMRAGVPESLIGLRHGKNEAELAEELAGECVPPSAMRDTRADDRPIMLVSHSRIRGPHGALFASHQGQPRNLLIWDETLFTSHAGTLLVRDLRTSDRHFEGDPLCSPLLSAFIKSTVARIAQEIDAQRGGRFPSALDLGRDFDLDQIRRDATCLRGPATAVHRAAVETVQQIIRLAERPASVALTGNGSEAEALIHYRIVVDAAWDNVAVLDASHPIRTLAQLSGIQDATTEAMRACKTYGAVRVCQHRVAASRSTQGSVGAAGREGMRLAAQIIQSIPDNEPILIFAFKSTKRRLIEELNKEGISLSDRVNGEPRIRIETWGRETSSNAYSRCTHVLLVGVLRRNLPDLAASVSGERDDLLHRDDSARLRATRLSEMGSCVLQAMHRGACRTVDSNGEAGAMTLHIIDQQTGLRELLTDSLPGVHWQIEEPGKARSETFRGSQAVFSVLLQLPEKRQSISIIELLREARTSGVKLRETAWRKAINAALDRWNGVGRLSHPRCAKRWERKRLSLVRLP